MRKSISQSLRFQIFTRDAYTCQYCGGKPPDVTLVIDHRVPVSRGGDNDPMNLISACQSCNAGKSNQKPGEFLPTPDPDIQTLKLQQEEAEYRAYLRAKTGRDTAVQAVVEELQAHWSLCCGGQDYHPADKVVLGWLSRFSPELIERAISASASAFSRGIINSYDVRGVNQAIRYVSGIMYRMEEEESA